MDLEKFVSNEGRALPVFLLLDCSGSMSGEKINTLNLAVKDMLDDFKGERLIDVNLQLCVITFGDVAKVHQELANLNSFDFEDLTASGMTPLGGALNLLSEIVNDKEKVSSKGYKPVIVLVSDGKPNDEWNKPLEDFLQGKRTSKCERWALGIGADADYGMLQKFLGSSEKKVFDASAAREITQFFKLVTLSTIARSKSVNPNETIDTKELEERFKNDNLEYDFEL